eukprot:193766_1
MGNTTNGNMNKHKTFNKNNCTTGLKVSKKCTVISQNDYKTRSILATHVVGPSKSFQWNFTIQNWEGRCCRFGIINPQVKARGSIWSKPGAICVCIAGGCWTKLWGANSNTIQPPKVNNGDHIGIKIENISPNKACYATFYHNHKPIENAIHIQTHFRNASIFFELCGPVIITATDTSKAINDNHTLDKATNTRIELLICGYIMPHVERSIVPKDVVDIVIQWYKSFYIKTFNPNNCSIGMQLSENETVISQADNVTRSILSTDIVSDNEKAFWRFNISGWAGRCCRFGIMSPEIEASGSIWSQPQATCMCIHPSCWNRLWGAHKQMVNTTPFVDGQTVGVKIENRNKQCYVTWYHNDEPIDRAMELVTSLDKGCLFFELCGAVKVSLIDFEFESLERVPAIPSIKAIEWESRLNTMTFDEKTELLVSRYVSSRCKVDGCIERVAPTEIIEIIIQIYKILCVKPFDQSNCSRGMELAENDSIIWQKDQVTRSIMGTEIVNRNESFRWTFKIEDWQGKCCRFGIISPDIAANGSIWSKPNAICMCIYPSCWRRLWGANRNRVNPPAFKNGETVSIQIQNKNDHCYTTWFHNDRVIQNAIDIPTSLPKACFFFELCGPAKVTLISGKRI